MGEGDVGLGVFPGFGDRPGGGTSLLLRGTGLFWRDEVKDEKGEEMACEDTCAGS